jgi:hypothetical protein
MQHTFSGSASTLQSRRNRSCAMAVLLSACGVGSLAHCAADEFVVSGGTDGGAAMSPDGSMSADGSTAMSTGGDWGSASKGAMREAGSVSSSTQSLSAGSTNACESPWTIRLLTYHPTPVVPRKMYFASCTPPGGKTKLYTSITLKGASGTTFSGAVYEEEVDPVSGALKPTGVERQFAECNEMHGIATKSDCSVVGVLCRRASRSSETNQSTKDMVAALTDSGKKAWITQPGTAEQGEQRNDEEWLYDWADGNIAKPPATYVAHKAIGGWVYGSQALVYGETDNTYGLSLKATVFGGGWHEGDALLIVDRSNFTINEKRGWHWGCAAGHTLFNHATYNPSTSQYAVTCGTDLGIDPKNAGGFGGVWTHTESREAQGYQSVPLYKSLTIGGGPTSLLPLADGGFIGVFAGIDGAVKANQDFRNEGAVTSIGFAHFDKNGTVVGSIKRVASAPGVFLSAPQLAPLGKGTYLLGYTKMAAFADKEKLKFAYDDAFRIPTSYHVLEVDENGNALTQEQTLKGAGWGEQDQMVALGAGRVAWAYTPNAVMENGKRPSCESNQLALHVYTQK